MKFRKISPFKIPKQGFSLLELLLYVTISSMILLMISIFLSMLLQSRIKNQTIAEVEQQGLQIMQLMTQTLRNAEEIKTPTPGSSSPSASVDVVETAKDPTGFEIASGVVQITEGTKSAIPLNNNQVVASNLNFQNLSRPSTPGTLRIQFTLTHVNAGKRTEYDYQKTFTSSASLRHP